MLGRSMDDLLIDACRWHVNAEAPPYKERAQEHFREKYTVLLEFLRANDLLVDSSFGTKVEDWLSFEFKQSNLTEEGFALVKLCHGTWLSAFGQAHTQRHLTQWKRKLAQLRSNA